MGQVCATPSKYSAALETDNTINREIDGMWEDEKDKVGKRKRTPEELNVFLSFFLSFFWKYERGKRKREE